MVAQQQVTGMVLSAMPVGDYDKRIVILTKDRGKIAVFARGARKPNSPFLACSVPFCFGEFVIIAGKQSYSLVAVTIENYFTELRNDLETVYYGCYFCEFAAHVTRENNDEVQVLKLLYQTLRALGKESIDNRLIRYIFELKLMCIIGYTPQVFQCVLCDATTDVYRFSADCAGLVCEKCKTEAKGQVLLEGSTIYTMQYIVITPIEKLYSFMVTKQVLKELGKCVEQYVHLIIQTSFKSLEMLENLV